MSITNPFGIGWRSPSPACLLERAANDCIRSALAEAEATLKLRLQLVKVADLFVNARRLAPERTAVARRVERQRSRA